MPCQTSASIHASVAADADVVVFTDDREDTPPVYDGGRKRRTRDSFRLTLPAGTSRLVVRWGSPLGASMSVKVDGQVIDRLEIPPTAWLEESVTVVRAGAGSAKIEVESKDGRTFNSLHYWVYP